MRALQQQKVGKRDFDLLSVHKFVDPVVKLVWHLLCYQVLFEIACILVSPRQYRYLRVVNAMLGVEPLDLNNDIPAFFIMVEVFLEDDLVALLIGSPELLVLSPLVVRDEVVGRVQDLLGRPVVLFKLDDFG